MYLEAKGKSTLFHFTDGSLKTANESIDNCENRLNNNIFFRVHNAYIINLYKLANINKSEDNHCELLNGESLPIAKYRQEELYKFLKIK